ncbi:hypothetical protein ACJJTC_012779 [Scirpophaga incertulas]
MRVITSLVLVVTTVLGLPIDNQRIVGGRLTTIDIWPSTVALLFSKGAKGHRQHCAGTIITHRSVLTACHCTIGSNGPSRWLTRSGTSRANSGGQVHYTLKIIEHPRYSPRTYDNDIAIIQIEGSFTFTHMTQPASVPQSNYKLRDNSVVYAVGWGRTSQHGPSSEQLRQVQIWTVNQATCKQRYASVNDIVTDNMLCAGYLDVGGRGQCFGDSGGPLYDNELVIGITSWSKGCGSAEYPTVNTRVSNYDTWIEDNQLY